MRFSTFVAVGCLAVTVLAGCAPLSSVEAGRKATEAIPFARDAQARAREEQHKALAAAEKARAATAGAAGYGTIKYPNGAYYEGETSNGQRNGYGVFVHNEGRIEGKWSHDKVVGAGAAFEPNGDRYEGEFGDGTYKGYGFYTWADGRWYEGEFADGKLNGAGLLTKEKGVERAGLWKDGTLIEVAASTNPTGMASSAAATAPMSSPPSVTVAVPISSAPPAEPFEIAKKGGCIGKALDVCMQNLQVGFHFTLQKFIEAQMRKNEDVDVNGKRLSEQNSLSIPGYLDGFESRRSGPQSFDIEYTEDKIVKKIHITLPGSPYSANTEADYAKTGIYEAFVLMLGSECPKIERTEVYKFFQNKVKPKISTDGEKTDFRPTGVMTHTLRKAHGIPFCGRRFSYTLFSGYDTEDITLENEHGVFIMDTIYFE